MAIKFDITADNSGLLRATKQSEDAFQSLEERAQGTSDSIKSVFQQAAALGGISLGVAGMKQFVSKVYEVRSYFQDINSSMVAFLGNQEKADKFTKELKDYAWYNMFEFSELAQASQQMIAYGANVEDIIPTIDKLSNIAVATKANLLDLVGMYNKAKSVGKVDSQATATWATHGLVIKNFLSDADKAAGSTTYTFEQLDKAITNSTSEGGLFFQQQEKMMDNLSSSWGQLQDDMDSMFNEIGESMQKPMKKGIEFASELVDNYKEYARILAEIVATYGLYKAAMAGATSMDKMAGNITTQAEIEELQKYIVVEEEAKNEDLKAMVSKGELSQASYDRIAALRAETAAEEEQRAKELDSAVLRGQITEGRANEVKSLREKMAVQLDLARVEEETAKEAYQSAKDSLSAINEEIDSYYKAIASHEELGDATYKQLHASEAATLQDKKAAAQKAVLTAEENLNTASIRRNTLEQERQIVMQQVSIKTMGLQKAAALQLKNIWSSITAMVDANPIMIYAAAIAALCYGVYKLVTAETEEEKARRRSNEAWDEFKSKQEEYAHEVDNLVSIVQDENKTQNQRYAAWNRLKTLMPQITDEYKSMIELANADRNRVEQIKNEVEEQEERKKVLEDVANAEKRVADARRQLDQASSTMQSGNNTLPYVNQLAKAEAELKAAKDRQKEFWRTFVENQEQAARDAKPIEVRIKEAEDNKERIDNAVAYLGRATDIMKSMTEDVPMPMRVDQDTAKKNLDNLIEEVKSKLEEAKEYSKNNPLSVDAQANEKSLEDTLKSLLESKEQWEQNGYTYVPIKLGLDEASLKETSNRLQEEKNELEEQLNNSSKKDEIRNKQYWENQKKKAEESLQGLSTEQLDQIRRGKADEATKKTYQEAKKNYDDAVKQLNKYDITGKSLKELQKKKAEQAKLTAEYLETIADNQRALDRSVVDNIFAATQATIDALDEGVDKENKQRELNKQKAIEQIRRDSEDKKKAALEAAKKEFEKNPSNKDKQFSEEDANANKTYLNTINEIDKESKLKLLSLEKEVLQNEKEYTQKYLDEYGSMMEKRVALTQAYNADIVASNSEAQKKLLEAERDAQLRAMDRQEQFKRLDVVQGGGSAIANELMPFLTELRRTVDATIKSKGFSSLSEQEQREIIEQNEMLNSMGVFSENILSVNDAARELATAMKKSDETGKKLKEANNKLIDAQAKFKTSQDEYNANYAKYTQLQENAMKAEIDGDAEMAKYYTQQADLLQQYIDTTKADMEVQEKNITTLKGKVADFTDKANVARDEEAQSIKNYTDAVTQSTEKFDKVMNTFSQYSSASGIFAQLGEKIGGVWGAILSILGQIKGDAAGFIEDIFSDVAGIIETLLTQLFNGDIITSVFRGVGNIFQSIGTAFGFVSSNEKETEKRIDALKDSADYLTKSLDKLSDQLESAKGFGNTKEAIDAQKEQMQKLAEIYSQQLVLAQGKYGEHHSNDYYMSHQASAYGIVMGNMDISQRYTRLVNEVLARYASERGTQASSVSVVSDAAKLSAEELAYIRKNEYDLWQFLTSTGEYDNSEFWNQIADLGDKIEEFADTASDKLAGITFDDMYDSFLNTLMDMESSTDDFVDNLSEMFTKMLISNKVGDAYSKQLEEWYEEYKRLIDKNGGSMTDADVDYLQSKYKMIVDQAIQTRDEIAKITGYESTSSRTSNSVTGMAANVSQDSIDEANGRMTAIQLQNEAQIAHLLTVATNTSLLLTTAETTNTILDDIRTMDALRNSYLMEMVEIATAQRKEQAERLDKIANSLKNI